MVHNVTVPKDLTIIICCVVYLFLDFAEMGQPFESMLYVNFAFQLIFRYPSLQSIPAKARLLTLKRPSRLSSPKHHSVHSLPLHPYTHVSHTTKNAPTPDPLPCGRALRELGPFKRHFSLFKKVKKSVPQAFIIAHKAKRAVQ